LFLRIDAGSLGREGDRPTAARSIDKKVRLVSTIDYYLEE